MSLFYILRMTRVVWFIRVSPLGCILQTDTTAQWNCAFVTSLLSHMYLHTPDTEVAPPPLFVCGTRTEEIRPSDG